MGFAGAQLARHVSGKDRDSQRRLNARKDAALALQPQHPELGETQPKRGVLAGQSDAKDDVVATAD